MERRAFVKSGALALVTLGLSPSFLRRTAFAQELAHGAARLAGKGKVLVCLFQRGAADALNVVVPFGDRSYYALRPNIAVADTTLSIHLGPPVLRVLNTTDHEAPGPSPGSGRRPSLTAAHHAPVNDP